MEHAKELRTVHQVSKLTGISIRALHYYDKIGLLTPAVTTEAGYRLYDDANLERLQDIMLFRELEFSLKDIKKIIERPGFDRIKALDDQIRLLELKRDHLEELIVFAQRLKVEGETNMSFEAFDKSKIEAYENMAKEIWGETDAYKEYEQKTAKATEVDKRKSAEDMMHLFYEFGELKDKEPANPIVQAQVKKLQDFITANYYTCTNEILAGLGQMYVAGGEMTQNIDVAGGKGCAEFVAEAIAVYCRKSDGEI